MCRERLSENRKSVKVCKCVCLSGSKPHFCNVPSDIYGPFRKVKKEAVRSNLSLFFGKSTSRTLIKSSSKQTSKSVTPYSMEWLNIFAIQCAADTKMLFTHKHTQLWSTKISRNKILIFQ